MKTKSEILLSLNLLTYAYHETEGAHADYIIDGVTYHLLATPEQFCAMLQAHGIIEGFMHSDYSEKVFTLKVLNVDLDVLEEPTYSFFYISIQDFMREFSKHDWNVLIASYHQRNEQNSLIKQFHSQYKKHR